MPSLKEFGESMLDKAFPLRRLGRMAVTTEVARSPMAKHSTDPEYRNAMDQESEYGRHAVKELGRLYNNQIQRAVTGRSMPEPEYDNSDFFRELAPFKKGGKVSASKASKRADGIAQRGKTRGKMV